MFTFSWKHSLSFQLPACPPGWAKASVGAKMSQSLLSPLALPPTKLCHKAEDYADIPWHIWVYHECEGRTVRRRGESAHEQPVSQMFAKKEISFSCVYSAETKLIWAPHTIQLPPVHRSGRRCPPSLPGLGISHRFVESKGPLWKLFSEFTADAASQTVPKR